MKSTVRALALFFAVLLGAAIARGEEKVLTILHVNDTHSHLDATGPKDANLDGTVGGLVKAAAIIGTVPHDLLLHAGDIFHGDLFFNAYFGVPELGLMMSLGFDAMTIGNHEFDLGPDVLAMALGEAFAGGGTLPLLSANVDLSAYESANPQGAAVLKALILPAVVKDVGGVKVGIFGMTVPNVPTARPDPVKLLGGDDPAVLLGIAAGQMQGLRAGGAQVVICLSHLGILYDQALAQNVPGIDVIVGGHDHYEFARPIEVVNPAGTKTLIVQAGHNYEKVGKLTILFDGSSVSLADYALLPVDASVPKAPAVQAVVDALKAGIVEKYGDVYHTRVARASRDVGMSVDPDEPARDIPMGNLITDSYRWKTRTDIAITPFGLISEGIPAGPIVGADIFRPVSYGYDPPTGLGLKLATLKITGAELVKGLEIGLAYLGLNEDFFLHVSGMSFAYDPTRPPGGRVLLDTVRIDGKALKPGKTYTMSLNTGLAALIGLMGIQVTDLKELPDLEYDVLRAYIVKLRCVAYRSEGRIVDASVKLKGDLDGDGKIDAADFLIFLHAFGKKEGQKGYVAAADYDADGRVTFADYLAWMEDVRAACRG
jgi:5'-nucleotidase / UDP-sugar diphosphatase